MSQPHILDQEFTELNCCVIIPTYNNEKTLARVIEDTLSYTSRLIVVNDGATDSTAHILGHYAKQITLITHPVNAGKGRALRNGFKKALELGYRYAITLDSDGQHFASDLGLFLAEIRRQPDALIIGARNMNSENVPGGSSFGNKFSNFWFRVETGITLPDTQSGYRLYPIRRMQGLRFFSSRFEFEVEVIVKAAWKNIVVTSIPIQIYYAKGRERISHFRPGIDFTRISFLNTWLVILALLWHKPLRFFKSLTMANLRAFIQKHFFSKEESIAKKSLSVSTGIFFGIVPIWGYQLVTAIAAAYLFRLNKAIVILTANISIPPLLPFVLLGSLKTGELVTGRKASLSLGNISLASIQSNLFTYLWGACLLAIVLAVFGGAFTYVALHLMKRGVKK